MSAEVANADSLLAALACLTNDTPGSYAGKRLRCKPEATRNGGRRNLATETASQTEDPERAAEVARLREQVSQMSAQVAVLEQELAARSLEAQQWRAKCSQLGSHSATPVSDGDASSFAPDAKLGLCLNFLLGKCTSCSFPHLSGWDALQARGITKADLSSSVLDTLQRIPQQEQIEILNGLARNLDDVCDPSAYLAGILAREKEVLCFNFLAGKCRFTDKCARTHVTGWDALACRGVKKESINPVVVQSLCRLPLTEQTELLNQIAAIPNLQRIHNFSAYLADRVRRQFPGAPATGQTISEELCTEFLNGDCDGQNCCMLHLSGWDALKFMGIDQSHFEHEVLKSLRTLAPVVQTAVLNEMATCRLSSIRNLSGFLAHVIDKHRKRARNLE